MLPQHQPVTGIQRHIKRILGSGGHLIAAAVVHVVVLAVVGFGRNLRNSARPAGIVYAGVQHHGFIFINRLYILLADRALHTEFSVGHDLHQHICAVRLKLFGRFQGLHRSGDLRSHCGIVNGIL